MAAFADSCRVTWVKDSSVNLKTPKSGCACLLFLQCERPPLCHLEASNVGIATFPKVSIFENEKENETKTDATNC